MSEPTKINSGIVTTLAATDLIVGTDPGGGTLKPITLDNLLAIVRSNLQIGGRNLLKGSGDWSSWLNQPGRHVVGPDTYNGLTVVHLSDIDKYQGMLQSISLDAGESCVLSFYCKAKTAGTVILRCLDKNNSNGKSYSFTISEPDTWKRYTIHPSMVDGITQVRMERGNGSATEVCYCGVKLERGNVATDWTPAPEDLGWGGGKSKIYNYLRFAARHRAERRAS